KAITRSSGFSAARAPRRRRQPRRPPRSSTARQSKGRADRGPSPFPSSFTPRASARLEPEPHADDDREGEAGAVVVDAGVTQPELRLEIQLAAIANSTPAPMRQVKAAVPS